MKNKEDIVKLLNEKLDWYTYEASPEEFSAEEVESIILLLSKLEPVPESEKLDTEVALRDFMELHPNTAKKHRRFACPALKAGLAVALCVLVILVSTSITSYATGNMGFFKFLSQTDKGWSFMVTGEQNDNFQTWDELPSSIKNTILVPCTPIDYNLESIIYSENDNSYNIYATYTNSSGSIKLSIYNLGATQNDTVFVSEVNGINIYTSSNAYYFHIKDIYYRLSGTIADTDTAITLIKEFFP